MKKSNVYEGNKSALVATLLLIVIVFSASYAYFTSYNNAKVDYDISIGNELDITYLLTAGSNLTLTVNPSDLETGNVGEYAESSVANDVVSLANNSEYPNITCTYQIIYEPSKVFINSSYNTEGTPELVVMGSDSSGSNGSFTFDLNGVGSSTVMKEGSISTASPTTTASQTWTFTLRHYNIDANQNEHMGKTFGGKIYFKSTGCRETTLSDRVIALADGSERQSSQTGGGVYRVINPEVNVPNPVNYTKLSESEYGTITEYKGDSESTITEAGTPVSGMFDYSPTDNTWTNDTTNMEVNSYYHMVIPITENGSYKVCYKVTKAGKSNNFRGYITDNGNTFSGYQKFSTTMGSVGSTYTCTNMGYLITGQAIRIVNSTGTTKAAVTFYIQKSTEVTASGNAGIRYQGKDPDNYVTFNGNESWRIIGVFEGSTIGLESGKYYTKLIKSTSIGGYDWDETNRKNNWLNASLNTYLRDTYLPSMDDDSKGMIAYATYYLGGAPSSAYNSYTSAQFYTAERGSTGGADSPTTVSHQNYLGLMYPSDYGFAMYAGSAACTTDLVVFNYSTSDQKCANYDWMFLNAYEWTITPNSDNSDYAFAVYLSGYVNYGYVYNFDYGVRPVLYLEASVTVSGGSGTSGDPYILEYE